MKTSKTCLIFLSFFIACSMGCSEQIQGNQKNDWTTKGIKGRVKELQTEIYSYHIEGESLVMDSRSGSYNLDEDEQLQFNELGFLISESRSGIQKNYTYDAKNRLSEIKIVEHYGGQDENEFYRFFYDKRDSIIKRIINKDENRLETLVDRDRHSRVVKVTEKWNDTVQNTFVYKHDSSGNVIEEIHFLNSKKPSKIINRVFKDNLLASENYQVFKVYDTIHFTESYKNIFLYDDMKRNHISKYNYKNDSSYTLISNVYDDDSHLIQSTVMPIGARLYNTITQKWDSDGNLIQYSKIDSETKEERITIYNYTFDNAGNWVTKEISGNNKNYKTIVKRKITYY